MTNKLAELYWTAEELSLFGTCLNDLIGGSEMHPKSGCNHNMNVQTMLWPINAHSRGLPIGWSDGARMLKMSKMSQNIKRYVQA